MKAFFGIVMVLAIGADCARIKRHRASGMARAEVEDFVTIIKSEAGERVDDRREQGEWIWGSSSGESEVAANNTASYIKDIMKAAAWAINKSMQAKALIPKWNNLKLALNETQLAAEKSADAVVSLKDKLLEATVLFASSGLQNLSQALKDGAGNNSQMVSDLLANVGAKNGAEDFAKALEAFKSTTIELSEIASSSDMVLKVMKGARTIIDEVVEITGTNVFVGAHMQTVDELEAQVKVGIQTLHELADKVEKTSEQIKPMVDNLITGARGQAEEATDALTGEVKDTLVEFADEVQMVKEVFTEVIEPFVPELIAAVRAVTDAANKYTLAVDAPEHVAEEDMGRWTGCAWRSTRWFDNITDVDLDNTMTCEMEWYGRYRCHCIAFDDCYATEWYRPEPQGLKRCFRQVGFSIR